MANCPVKPPCTKPGRYSMVLSVKAVSTAWAYFFNWLSAVQHHSCSRCRCTSPWSSMGQPVSPQIVQRVVVCWQIDGLGMCHVSSLKFLCGISEIWAASNLCQHTCTPFSRYEVLTDVCSNSTVGLFLINVAESWKWPFGLCGNLTWLQTLGYV